jgi:hypothetical protein
VAWGDGLNPKLNRFLADRDVGFPYRFAVATDDIRAEQRRRRLMCRDGGASATAP